MMSGYWQVELDGESREKSAFICPQCLYNFKIMPFELVNAPSTFQRLMEWVLRGISWVHGLIYVDDVIVYSETFSQHLQHLRSVFDRLSKVNMTLKPRKCILARPEVKYLGRIISRKGIRTDPEIDKAVATFPAITNVRELQAYLGLANYYRCLQPSHPH